MTSHQMCTLHRGLTGTLVLLLIAGPAAAIDVAVSMNQAQYYPGDPMEITVTAYNPGPTDVTLTFPSGCQAYYQMGSYRAPELCSMSVTYATIPALGSRTWNLQHSWSSYNPGPGVHTVTAGLVGYAPVRTVSFEVVVPVVNLELSLGLNKPQFRPGETMEITVTAYNPEPTDAKLFFPSDCQMHYEMGSYSAPGECNAVITKVTIPARGAHTWHMRHSWSAHNPGPGTHSLSVGLYEYGPAGTVSFEVVESVPPTRSFLVDFERVPGTDIPLICVEQLWPYGLHGRSVSGDPPRVAIDPVNQYLVHGRCTYPTGFNIVLDFDMPVYGVMANVGAGAGRGVTMIARAADGTELDRAAVPSAPYLEFSAFLSVRSSAAIASIEWWPSQTNVAIGVDNLYLSLAPVRADLDGDGDVDQADVALFEACRTGPEVIQTAPACLSARLDEDEDVDQSDFGIFQCGISG